MKIKINFYGVFKQVFKKDEIEMEFKKAVNIGFLLELLCDLDECRKNIIDDHGEIKPNVLIFKNGKPINSFNGIKTILQEGDKIAILPMMFGG